MALLLMQDTELTLRIGRQGHEAWHAQSAVVEHVIREEHLRKDWMHLHGCSMATVPIVWKRGNVLQRPASDANSGAPAGSP